MLSIPIDFCFLLVPYLYLNKKVEVFEQIHTKSNLKQKIMPGTTQEQRKKYYRNEQFMRQWIKGVNCLIRRLVEIESMFKR